MESELLLHAVSSNAYSAVLQESAVILSKLLT